MDPHFNEYRGAIAGMDDLYGDRPDDQPTEFHDDREGGPVAVTVASGAAA
ncbi:MAG: hypothetical protein ACK6CT_12445 [Planctomycetia bacterium]|jgi:hypothetical protein